MKRQNMQTYKVLSYYIYALIQLYEGEIIYYLCLVMELLAEKKDKTFFDHALRAMMQFPVFLSGDTPSFKKNQFIPKIIYST
jgi:hypothetical protein